MSAHDYDSHRCEGLLKARCSIRRMGGRTIPFRQAWMRTDGKWHLYQQIMDFDYDCTFMNHVARITYCPWCGEEL